MKITTALVPLPFYILLISLASCSVNSAKIDNSLKNYFDNNKVEGSFTLLNNSDGKVTVYNLSLDTTRFAPAATFDIENALIGVETGVITDEKMVIKWDGVNRANTQWNKDLTMEQAFKASAIPYFQEVARRIGKDTMKLWLDSTAYGNRTIGEHLDSFWMNKTLKISADEQLGFVKRLYFDQLAYQKRTQQVVRDAMQQESNTQYDFYYRTAITTDKQQNNIGWVVGWIEENKHPYFFVTVVKTANQATDIKAVQLKVTKEILTHLGFFKGMM